jgi:hypothetical protein
MHEELIRLVQEIQAHKKSGLLMAVVQISAQAQADNDISALSAHPDFSFFFKEGVLAAVVSRGIRGGSVNSKIASIASITRTQWMATNSSTISSTMTAADEPLGTDKLLELLGAKKLEKIALEVRKDKARLALGLELDARSEEVFLQVLGRNGDAALKRIRNHCNPCNDPDGFTKACVTELEPLVGTEGARALMS